MSVQTEYDDKRDILKENLSKCLEGARELLDENISGFEEMRHNYAIDIYHAIKLIRDEI